MEFSCFRMNNNCIFAAEAPKGMSFKGLTNFLNKKVCETEKLFIFASRFRNRAGVLNRNINLPSFKKGTNHR